MGLVPLTMVAALFETCGAAAVFLLVKIVNDPAESASLPFVSSFADWLGLKEAQSIILAFTVALATFYLLKNLFTMLHTYALGAVASHSTATFARRLFQAYLAQPYAFHFRRNSSDLIRNLTTSVQEAFRVFLGSVLTLVTEALVVAGIAVVLLVAAPMATLLLVGVFGTLAFLLVWFTQRTFAAWGEQEHGLQQQVVKTAQQTLGGIKELKISGREIFFYESFSAVQGQLARIHRLRTTLLGLPRVLVETAFIFGILSLVTFMAFTSTRQADLLPLLGLYAYAGFRVIPSLNRILMHAGIVQGSSAAVSQVYDDLQKLPALGLREADHLRPAPLPFTNQLVVDGLSFTYEGSTTPAVNDIHATIRHGESIGIVGPTGAGKSTLLDLFLGLLSATSGSITVDGRDIDDNIRAWQRKIGYVPQEIYLLDDTLRRNIALGLTDAEISEEHVQTALRLAQLDSFVSTLPRGLDTEVGERGIRLSGGQRQRLGIARSLYHGPELLIFDEATSALDNQTESEITRAIESLHGKKTLIIVAHRLTTIHNCDRLLFLKDGKLETSGSYDELLAASAEFRRIATGSTESRASSATLTPA